MTNFLTEARKRQLARLRGAKPLTARAAMALAKSQSYQDAADAPATLRAYAADLSNYKAWCEHGFEPLPAAPHVVGAYLAAAGEAYALPTHQSQTTSGAPIDTSCCFPPSVIVSGDGAAAMADSRRHLMP